MERIKEDKAREERIHDEIVVDAYGEIERALGWYCHLDDNLAFPFQARCVVENSMNPLKLGETVEVYKLASEASCEHEIFVMTHWKNRSLGIPLAQLVPIDADHNTVQAVEDWHYWVARGYQF